MAHEPWQAKLTTEDSAAWQAQVATDDTALNAATTIF
jgi:hypothetical protein